MFTTRRSTWTACAVAAFVTVIGAGLILNIMRRPEHPRITEVLELNPLRTPSLRDKLQAEISNPRKVALQVEDIESLTRLYSARNFQPLWFENERPTRNARQAVKALNAADKYGLSPQFYDAGDLFSFNTKTLEARAAFEFRLTAAVLHYARDMRIGHVKPESVYREVSLPARTYDAVADLSTAANDDNIDGYLNGLSPLDPQYRWLEEGLVRYRKIAAAGGWPEVPNDKEMSSKTLVLLGRRLATEGYLSTDNRQGEDVPVALRRYQEHNGLKPDGKLGEKTLAMLNVSAADRATTIAANMERWRWLPSDLGARRIVVNVADATLALVQDGSEVFTSIVVVGAPATPTPMLQTTAVALTVNPVWHVPTSIIKKEILPKLSEDPSYLERKNMRMEDNRIEQGPGPENALGLLKFEMPNAFDIYLHDTPSKKAFEADDRAKSHGCIRVQAILPLAALALSGNDSMGADQIAEWIASGETSQHRLQTPIPVYILYWTAIANEGGIVAFRRDIYGRDSALTAVLSGVGVKLGA